jgi:DUF2934 family protein
MKVSVQKTTTITANTTSKESAVDLEKQIRRWAYEFYEQRGGVAGHDTEDWLRAEAELTRERTKPLEDQRSKRIVEHWSQRPEKEKPSRLKKSRSSTQSKTD